MNLKAMVKGKHYVDPKGDVFEVTYVGLEGCLGFYLTRTNNKTEVYFLAPYLDTCVPLCSATPYPIAEELEELGVSLTGEYRVPQLNENFLTTLVIMRSPSVSTLRDGCSVAYHIAEGRRWIVKPILEESNTKEYAIYVDRTGWLYFKPTKDSSVCATSESYDGLHLAGYRYPKPADKDLIYTIGPTAFIDVHGYVRVRYVAKADNCKFLIANSVVYKKADNMAERLEATKVYNKGL